MPGLLTLTVQAGQEKGENLWLGVVLESRAESGVAFVGNDLL